MDWATPIDIYCERTSAAFWSEPVNALTNIAFIAAAYWGFSLARQLRALTPGVVILIILAASIGVGSFLFHTFANRPTMLMDIIPIAIFTLVAIFILLRRIFGEAILANILQFAVSLALMAVAAWISVRLASRFPLNGSEIYFPVFAILVALGLLAKARDIRGAHMLIAAGFVFVGALFCRTIDQVACEVLPIGTHPLWHIFNGLVVTFILFFAIVSAPAARKV